MKTQEIKSFVVVDTLRGLRAFGQLVDNLQDLGIATKIDSTDGGILATVCYTRRKATAVESFLKKSKLSYNS